MIIASRIRLVSSSSSSPLLPLTQITRLLNTPKDGYTMSKEIIRLAYHFNYAHCALSIKRLTKDFASSYTSVLSDLSHGGTGEEYRIAAINIVLKHLNELLKSNRYPTAREISDILWVLYNNNIVATLSYIDIFNTLLKNMKPHMMLDTEPRHIARILWLVSRLLSSSSSTGVSKEKDKEEEKEGCYVISSYHYYYPELCSYIIVNGNKLMMDDNSDRLKTISVILQAVTYTMDYITDTSSVIMMMNNEVLLTLKPIIEDIINNNTLHNDRVFVIDVIRAYHNIDIHLISLLLYTFDLNNLLERDWDTIRGMLSSDTYDNNSSLSSSSKQQQQQQHVNTLFDNLAIKYALITSSSSPSYGVLAGLLGPTTATPGIQAICMRMILLHPTTTTTMRREKSMNSSSLLPLSYPALLAACSRYCNMIDRDILYKGVINIEHTPVSHFELQQLSNALVAFSKVGVSSDKSLKRFTDRILHIIKDHHHHHDDVHHYPPLSTTTTNDINMKCIITAIHALATAQYYHPVLTHKLSSIIDAHKEYMKLTSSQYIRIMYALAIAIPEDIAIRISKSIIHIPYFKSPKEGVLYIWICAVLNIPIDYTKLSYIQWYNNNDGNTSGTIVILNDELNMMLYHASIVLLHNEDDHNHIIPSIPLEVLNRAKEVSINRLTSTSRLRCSNMQNNILSNIILHDDNYTCLNEVLLPQCGFIVDALIQSKELEVQGRGRGGVIIEVDGPYHFSRNINNLEEYWPTGASRLKNRIINQMLPTYHHISIKSWQQAIDDKDSLNAEISSYFLNILQHNASSP